jgi:hypothetical protein
VRYALASDVPETPGNARFAEQYRDGHVELSRQCECDSNQSICQAFAGVFSMVRWLHALNGDSSRAQQMTKRATDFKAVVQACSTCTRNTIQAHQRSSKKPEKPELE